ncbi:MAG: hypothetical protein IPJ25_13735 [Rhodocyclaceae bacterium]|nr:hypothetical protein [Rhodocyclaceae bacterium]
MTRWQPQAKNTAMVLDIKDQWPHLFVDALPKVLSRLGALFLRHIITLPNAH